jgi:hypothetical protein
MIIISSERGASLFTEQEVFQGTEARSPLSHNAIPPVLLGRDEIEDANISLDTASHIGVIALGHRGVGSHANRILR